MRQTVLTRRLSNIHVDWHDITVVPWHQEN